MDGSYIVAVGSNNTAKIWNVVTGIELLTLISIGENDWVVTNPDGFFDASDGAMESIHFVRGMKFIEQEELKKLYYEPNLLAKIMNFNDEPLLHLKAYIDTKICPEIELSEPTHDYPKLYLA